MNKSGISALKFIFLFYVKGEIFMLRKNFTEIANYVYSEGEYAKKSTVTGLDIKRTRIDKYTGFRRTCQKRGLRTKQLTKLKGIYGKWYHKTPSSQKDKKRHLKVVLNVIGYGSYGVGLLFKILTHSVIMTVFYTSLSYLIFKKINVDKIR